MATSKFGAAFKAAKKAGKKVFSFGGKSYNTKEEKTVKTPSSAPTPTSRPSKAAKTGTKRGRSGKGGGIATTSDVAGKIASEKKYTNDDIRSYRKKKK